MSMILKRMSKSLGSLQGSDMEKPYCLNSDKFGYSFIKNDTKFMYLLCIYKKTLF